MSLICAGEGIIIQYANLMATSISCDCNGQFAVLCGPRSISLVNLENPKEVVQTISRNGHLKFCGVQWHPHSFYSSLFLCGSNQCVELWSWDAATLNGSHKTTLKGHTRTINDFDWSIVEPTIVATCSADTNTYLWDIRESRRPSKTLQSVVCPSHVRWNPLSEKTLATAHEGDLKIWDLRKCNTPVQYIAAHDQKVTGMDWSPFNERQLATCSEDGSLKFWNINSQKQEENKIVSSIPFSKVKYMPFGNGVVTSYASQSGGTLNIWALGRMLSTQSRCFQPLCTFSSRGGQGVVVDFCLRIIDNDFQLLSWLSDCSLKVNRINSLIKQYCGNGLLNSSRHSSNSCESTPERDTVELNLNEVTPQSNDCMPRHRKTGNCLPPIPVRLDKLSTANARTLWLEFTLLNITIPDVVVTEMCAETQSLIVRVVKGGHRVHLTMTFPTEYPFKVSPEFFLSEDTTLDHNEKRRLIEDLKSTAVQHVQHGRHCIEPCLWRLIQSLDSIIMSKTSQLSPDTTANYLPMNEIWSPFLTEKLRDENIPFPRISGARFCGPGFLVCFTRRMFLDVPSVNIVVRKKQKRKGSESGITPRAMSALSEMAPPTRIPSTARPMRGFPSAARSLPLLDTDVPSVSQYYQLQDQMPKKSNSKPTGVRDQLPEEDKTATRNRKCPVGPVIVYDLSCLLPVQKVLGENYTFDRKDLVSMCRRNSQAAAAADRKDLVQIWSLASVQVSQFKGSNVLGDLSSAWEHHPFGQKLLNLWIDYYSSIGDVQTLAMISCTFGSVGNSAAQPSALKTTVTTPGCNNNANNVEVFTNSLKTDKDTVNSGQNSSVRKVLRFRSDSLSESKIEGADPSPNAATGERSRFSEYADSDDIEMRIGLLDSALAAKCDRFKNAYANILFQWGQTKQRAELLDYLSSRGQDENSRFCIEPSPSVNEKDTISAVVTTSVICVLCQLRVKGVVSLCAVCGHGGHTLHMLDWFGSHKCCASGCGCKCVYENPSELRAE